MHLGTGTQLKRKTRSSGICVLSEKPYVLHLSLVWKTGESHLHPKEKSILKSL